MKYFVSNWVKNEIWVCDRKEELISYFAAFNYQSSKIERNFLLDNIAMNKNDKKLKYDFYYSKNILIPREYMVYDEQNRIIDPRYYAELIFNYKLSKLKRKLDYLNSPYSNMKTSSIEKVKAIPRYGNKSGSYYRHPKSTSEKKQNAIAENKMYFRSKRSVKNLADAWDDISVHTEKSWNRLKLRKQYMKNTKYK
jgi:hypothetical protein